MLIVKSKVGKKSKTKMGRPPKPLAEKQDSRVVVNLTRVERSQLEREARAVDLSLSAYLVRCWKERRK
jgi:hypothetical protein